MGYNLAYTCISKNPDFVYLYSYPDSITLGSIGNGNTLPYDHASRKCRFRHTPSEER